MVVKEKWRIKAFRRMVKAESGSPVMIVKLRGQLAEVWHSDGKAVVVPGSLKAGILVCDWYSFMAYLRRRKRNERPDR